VNSPVDDVETRLRDAYRAAAQTIPPGAIRDLPERVVRTGPASRGAGRRRRAINGRVMVPIAAAAAVVAAAVLVPAFESGLLAGHGSQAPRSGGGNGSASAPPVTQPPPKGTKPTSKPTPGERKSPSPTGPPGAPAFFVSNDGGSGTTTYVYQTATGRVVAQIAVPQPDDIFNGVAPTANPLLYVVAIGHASECGSHLYYMRLTSDGQLSGYSPLPVPTLPEDVLSLAATPNAQFLAYVGEYCGGEGGNGGDVGYVNLATRAISRWTAPKQEDIGGLSLSASGAELTFTVGETKLFQAQTAVLATDSPSGGALSGSAQVIVSSTQLSPAGTVPEDGVLSPSGHTLYVCGAPVSLGSTPPPATPDPLVTFAGATLTHTTHLRGTGPCVISLDPSGRYLLAQTSTGAGTPVVQLIDVATGRATILHVPTANREQGILLSW
jgi:hypothetical protein